MEKITLPKSLDKNKWMYLKDSFVFNGVQYKSEEIDASNIQAGDVIVVTNGQNVEGVGEVTEVKPCSVLNKYREEVPSIYVSVYVNRPNCTSISFYEDRKYVTKLILSEAPKNKIFGFYPGMLTAEGIEHAINCSEVELYSLIESLGSYIFNTRHSMFNARIEPSDSLFVDVEAANYSLQFAVYQSTRFGVEIPAPEENFQIEKTNSYQSWYDWWHEYIKHTLTEEEYIKFHDAVANQEDLSSFRPKGDWRNSQNDLGGMYISELIEKLEETLIQKGNVRVFSWKCIETDSEEFPIRGINFENDKVVLTN